ncbi:MAG TPA: M15 family metallopeptidase [Pseudolysinimonas sp.]|nr:M15 family metallopeptidase [Pseudolysinimonas sp.]
MTDDLRRDRSQLRRVSPRVRRRRVIAVLILAALFAAIVVSAVLLFAPRPQEVPVAVTPTPTSTPTPSSTPTERPDGPLKLMFDKRKFSIDDPASLWVVVNKLRPLDPQNYAAPDLVQTPVKFVNSPVLRQEAADKIVAMFAAFKAETGKEMQAQSAYRSYDVQVNVYNGWVNQLGQAGADLTSARPGHSEHQTGLAMDISAVPNTCALDQCFADTAQGKWLAANAYKWGFILRYPNGMTAITGYEFEPWHYRYVGVELATEMHTTGIKTLEEFFGLPAAPDYAK